MDRITTLTAVAALPVIVLSTQSVAAESLPKPNVVWYMTEDTSPQYLALYNNGRGAKTPNLEALAGECVTYNNAFSNASVSSAARTTLITGCYAPSFGGSLHRRLELVPMPEGLRMFPSYLREAGYYTCNSTKTDYNAILDESAWSDIKGDIGGWRERESHDQPFFYVRTNAITHESKLLFKEETYKTVKTRNNPEDVYLHPNVPDTELMRYTYATFYDRIEESDEAFGQMVEMLREDGLMDNTFIFFFGDNGGCVPGTKGYTDDTGLHVPLLIYVPPVWREALGVEVGKSCDALVSFMDFGATVLSLAGIKPPKQMDGEPFLGVKSNDGRESVVCYGDRYDDLYAFNRVLYRDNFRYARNYQPYHAQGLYAYYRYKSLAFQQWREKYYAGELDEYQSSFFEPFGVEELYDTDADPNELNNLATDPAYRSVLKRMRKELAEYVEDHCDLGFFPETIILEEGLKSPSKWGRSQRKEIASYREVADLQLERYKKVKRKLDEAIISRDDVMQWWALTTAASYERKEVKSRDFIKEAKGLTKGRERSYLRMRAHLFLVKSGEQRSLDEKEIKDILHSSKSLAEVLLVLNDLTFMRESGLIGALSLSYADLPHKDYSAKERVDYLKL